MEIQRPWEKHYSAAQRNFDAENLRFTFLADPLIAGAREFADRPACTTLLPNGAHVTLSYGELNRLTDDLAAYLREVLKLTPDDVVAIMSPNCVGYPIASFGVYKTGCVATNINPLYTEREMKYQLQDSGAKVLLIADLFGDKASRVVPETGVEHVISLSLIDFFPPLKRFVMGLVLKHVRKMIPGFTIPVTTLDAALRQGAAARGGGDVSRYMEGRHTDDTAIYQYTGGTTGVAKGTELSHRNILANALQMELTFGDDIKREGEVSLVALPLYHIFAFTFNMINHMIMGIHSVLVPSPRPPSNLKSAFEGFPISVFAGVNTLFAALLREPWMTREATGKLKICIAGGMALKDVVAKDWEDKFGMPIVQGYGLTEVSCASSCNPLHDNRLGTIGIPLAGIDMAVLDDDGNLVPPGTPGELVVRGPTVMKGYLNRAEETAAALKGGWFHTGDVAVMDEEGYFRIVDRMKDMILVSGFNVYPNEVEEVIHAMPGVAEVAVIGIPDEHSGEVPKAFVVKRDPNLTDQDIFDFCEDKLTGYKEPRVIQFVDEIPKSHVGKILRTELRKMS